MRPKRTYYGIYKLNAVPSPHPQFTSYLVAWTPEAGACAITAFSDRNESDAFGTTTRMEFEAVSAELVSAFGEPDTVDEVRDKTPHGLWSTS